AQPPGYDDTRSGSQGRANHHAADDKLRRKVTRMKVLLDKVGCTGNGAYVEPEHQARERRHTADPQGIAARIGRRATLPVAHGGHQAPATVGRQWTEPFRSAIFETTFNIKLPVVHRAVG